MMKKISIAIMSVFLFAFIFGLSTGQALAEEEKKVLLKVQTVFSTALPTLGDSLVFFKEQIEAASGGSIKVKIYEPGKLVPTADILAAVSEKKITGGYTASGYSVGKLPAAEFFTAIPFSQSLPYYLGWIYFGNGWKLYQEMYDLGGYNVKVFPFCFLSPETAGWYRKEIKSPEDIKGLRIRYFGLAGATLSKLGASISTIPGGEIFPSLEKGAIDATEFSTPAIDTKLGFYKVAKYNYFPSWHQPATHLELIINKDVWNGMSARQKACMEIATRAVAMYSLAKSHAEQGKVVAENAEKHGTKNMVWSPEMLDLFKKTFLEVVEEEVQKDAFKKKVWEDYKAFAAETAPYECVAHLPRPSCK